jgi:hypothetical protein
MTSQQKELGAWRFKEIQRIREFTGIPARIKGLLEIWGYGHVFDKKGRITENGFLVIDRHTRDILPMLAYAGDNGFEFLKTCHPEQRQTKLILWSKLGYRWRVRAYQLYVELGSVKKVLRKTKPGTPARVRNIMADRTRRIRSAGFLATESLHVIQLETFARVVQGFQSYGDRLKRADRELLSWHAKKDTLQLWRDVVGLWPRPLYQRGATQTWQEIPAQLKRRLTVYQLEALHQQMMNVRLEEQQRWSVSASKQERSEREKRHIERLEQLHQRLALPPGASLLKTLEEYEAEGNSMHHCVGMYWYRHAAAKPREAGYIYHLETDIGKATAEIYGDRVAQLCGPCNQHVVDELCELAEQVLEAHKQALEQLVTPPRA